MERTVTEGRWPVLIAVVGVGGCTLALPDPLQLGPRWAIPSLVAALLVGTAVAHRSGNHRLDSVGGYAISIVVTLAMVFSLGRLIAAMASAVEPPAILLRSASILWITNFLVFSLWYWRLDAGGPHEREKRGAHTAGAFYFPQMMYGIEDADGRAWVPNFIDYLFLAFCTSTTLGPTDTPVLSRWAKLLTAVQASISLLCVALLASRAVGLM